MAVSELSRILLALATVLVAVQRGAEAVTTAPTPSPTRYCYTNMCGLDSYINRVGVWGGAITTWLEEENDKLSTLVDELYAADASSSSTYYYYYYYIGEEDAKTFTEEKKNKVGVVQLNKSLKKAIDLFAQGEHLKAYQTDAREAATTTLAAAREGKSASKQSEDKEDEVESRGLSFGQLTLLGSVALVAGVLSKHVSK